MKVLKIKLNYTKCGFYIEKFYIYVFLKRIYIYSVYLELIGNFLKEKKG